MVITSKAHILNLLSKDSGGVTNFLGTVATDTDRDNIIQKVGGDIVIVSDSDEAGGSSAIYFWTGNDWELLSSSYLINQLSLSSTYTKTEIDTKLGGLGIYPPVTDITELNAIPNSLKGYLCTVNSVGGSITTYQKTDSGWVKLFDSQIDDLLTTIASSFITLTENAEQTKFWKAPVTSLAVLNALVTPLDKEVRVVDTGNNSSTTVYRYDATAGVWRPLNTSLSFSTLASLSGYTPLGRNNTVFVESENSFYWYNPTNSTWEQVGGSGGATTYTNANPTPYTVGGISANSTFLEKTTTEMFDALLYPPVNPQISSFATVVAGAEGTTLQNGKTVTSVDITYNIVPKSNPVVEAEYFINNVSVLVEALPNLVGTTPQSKTLGLSYNTVNSTLTFKVVVKDSTGATVTATKSYVFRDKLYKFTSSTDYINVGVTPAQLSTAFNLLTGTYATTRVGTESFSPSVEYVYHVWKKTLGFSIPPVAFKINGLSSTAIQIREFQHTNTDGYTTDYVIFRTDYLLNNTFTFEIN